MLTELTEEENMRFELEQAIIACGNIADDVDMLMDALMDPTCDRERLMNALIGMRELHEMRCKKAFDIFSAMIQARLIV
jgi:hypothetical protein